ncbi:MULTISPECIES: hypothetical protein [Pseudomonas]|uniref:hypothetical protein n=1 Tax=Pseudomonas TaxID=286 RepID=UPI001C5B7CD2|nr:hypothetical protein [Pseudomonas sp. Xaverov 259]
MLEPRTAKKALNFPDAEKPGAYKLASLLKESIVNAGDIVSIDQYITGYGANSGLKLVCYISNKIFDESASTLTTELSPPSEKNNNTFQWGLKKIPVENGGFSLTPGKLQLEHWPKAEAIFDTTLGNNYILTERSLSSAPFAYKLQTLRNAKAGVYYLSFYLTYFNGNEWVCEEDKVDFRINSTFERYNTTISLLAATALIVTIFHDGVGPLFEIFHEIAKFVTSFKIK